MDYEKIREVLIATLARVGGNIWLTNEEIADAFIEDLKEQESFKS